MSASWYLCCWNVTEWVYYCKLWVAYVNSILEVSQDTVYFVKCCKVICLSYMFCWLYHWCLMLVNASAGGHNRCFDGHLLWWYSSIVIFQFCRLLDHYTHNLRNIVSSYLSLRYSLFRAFILMPFLLFALYRDPHRRNALPCFSSPESIWVRKYNLHRNMNKHNDPECVRKKQLTQKRLKFPKLINSLKHL